MTTGLDVTTTALRIVQVADIGGAPSGEDTTFALSQLNTMLNGWRLDGIDLELGLIEAGTTLASDTKYDETIIYNLARRLAPAYQRAITGDDMNIALEGLRLLHQEKNPVPTLTLPKALTYLPSRLDRDVRSTPASAS